MATKKFFEKDQVLYFWSLIKEKLNSKVDKVSGKGLSTNDYTTVEKDKLTGIQAGAGVNVQSDWDSTSGDSYIKNKPTLGTASSKNVSATGDAGSSEVVLGDDTRLSDARNAKDVNSWAKAPSKPSYTKGEVGLGNVDNTSDINKPVSDATKTALGGKVDKVTGKALSTNDYTTVEKDKLTGIESGAQVNKVLSVNGKTGDVLIDVPVEVLKYTEQTLTDTQKTQARTNIGAGTSNFSGNYVDLTNKPSIPTLISQLSNDLDFQTFAEVAASIQAAITGLGTVFDLKGSKATVTDLPKTENTIGDVWYVEAESVGYIWIKPSNEAERWEKFGESIDLTGYWSKQELVAMTNVDVDSIINS